MRTWPLLALPALPALVNALEPLRGVPPSLAPRFTPDADGTWRCLSTTHRIPWTAVNDDYCDCDDGSDEPATGACKDTQFYCHNEGHIGASIPSSRVNDGLCEADCCDGSDERPGVCPNVCAKVGAEYRSRVDADRKLRKTGSKLRSSYIAFAQKEKKRLEAAVASAALEVTAREKEVARLKDIAERTESISAAAMAHKKESPLYAALTAHADALRELKRAHDRHAERARALGDILDGLRTNYNPNYQDMGVLEAVRGWEALAGLPHINDVRKADAAQDAVAEVKTEDADVALSGEGEKAEGERAWSEQEVQTKLRELERQDFESLLLEHEKHVGGPTAESLLFDVSAYLPDALVPQFEAFRDTIISWLTTVGVVSASSDNSAAATKARQALADGQRDLQATRDERRDAEAELRGLFDVEKFGAEGEWKKLQGLCIEKDTGEYTYEVCLFDEARQKPNKGGQSFSLGKWKGWNPDGHIGSEEYYSKQLYTDGAKCWNGPNRSVRLLLRCGLENAILSVAEPEKCEYELTGTTPALCIAPDAEPVKKEEL